MNKIFKYNGVVFDGFQLQIEESKDKKQKKEEKIEEKIEKIEKIEKFSEYKERIQTEEQERKSEDFKVFVGNLNPKCSEKEIREVFQECGEVLDVVRPQWKDTGRLKNFAFIFFGDSQSVENALKWNGTPFYNQNLNINIPTKDKPKEEEKVQEFLMRDPVRKRNF
jgi:RNA recognition motif-containing protein